MKRIYYTGCLFLSLCAFGKLQAQTHYGTDAGKLGTNHTFLGTEAGKVNQGSNNTFIGAFSGKLNFFGQNNTFIGTSSGSKTVDGSNNLFLGSFSGELNTSGAGNVFLGVEAGKNNSTASRNTYVGYRTGHANSVGQGNTLIGYNAGMANETESNTFIGDEAGTNTQSGYENCFVGKEAGYFNKYGTENAFFGTYSGNESSGHYNSFFGVRSGYQNMAGQGNSFFGYRAGQYIQNGQDNTFIGINTGSDAKFSFLHNATAIGANAKVNNDNSIVLGNNANVGIGVSAPNYKLQLNTFSAAKPGTSTWIVASDRRLKKDVSDFKDGLDLITKIKPVWFAYNGEAGIETDKKFVGVIAQDMKEIAPYTVGNFTYQDSLGNKTEYLDYDAGAVTYMLVNAVKEQQEIIDQKEAKIQDLAKRLELLERIVASGTIKPLTGSNAARQEPSSNGVTLEQNAPNGFSQSTAIRFFIPQSVKEAVINVYTVAGVKVGSYPVAERGDSSLTLSADEFENGVFVYDLVTDGKSNGARKMMVAK
ncbi:tail fiber domain-containing protein [Dyadobacter sp. LJ53]|uniref:tail fiber domain-containing protein n=1 Tax=Dyadobacter chenwenxiniae TaxID=2906456 RepID=UPI001F3F63AC|nr:tail fiber domain-containing protein [Dyadobacter chenwenxiniae]MCF0053430.1 tail fiber domain-containing protein [Dyadobacter chenwenxiniae]